MPRESASRMESEPVPDLQPQEQAPASERRLKQPTHPEDHVFAEQTLKKIQRNLNVEQELQPYLERQEALAATATVRANLLKRTAELERTDPERAWELLHELHSYEFDLEGELEKAKELPEYVRGTDAGAMTRWSLEDALDVVHGTLAEIRPVVHSAAARMAEEDPGASHAHRTFWEDARETRQALETGALDAEEQSQLVTLFKERAAQVETEHTLLLERAMESRSPEDRQALEHAARAMAEIHAALYALEQAEHAAAQTRTRETDISENENDSWRMNQEKKVKRIVNAQKKLESAIISRYGRPPEELIARGGTGFRGMLGRLVGQDDPFEQWRELDRQREEVMRDTESAVSAYMPKGIGEAKARSRKTDTEQKKWEGISH